MIAAAVGAILSGVSHPSAADDSGWAIYSTAEAVNDSPAPLQDTTKQVRGRSNSTFDVNWHCLHV